jgi:hypothetical protein
MEAPALETDSAASLQAPKSHLPSLVLWQRQGRPQTATTAAEVLVGTVFSS